MIQKFVDKFMASKDELRKKFATHPGDYLNVVKALVEVLHDENDDYNVPDPERIHMIDEGHYQGTLVFVIGCVGYQPSTYWAMMVRYGSCSGCDILRKIEGAGNGGEKPTEDQIDQYVTLALHLVQSMKEI